MWGVRREWGCCCRRQLGLVQCGLRRHARDNREVKIWKWSCHVIGIVKGPRRGEDWHDAGFWLSQTGGTGLAPLLSPHLKGSEVVITSQTSGRTRLGKWTSEGGGGAYFNLMQWRKHAKKKWVNWVNGAQTSRSRATLVRVRSTKVL